jgi:ABC-type polysaccharide transport system, permease component
MEIVASTQKKALTGRNKAVAYIRRYWFLYLLVLPGLSHTAIFKISPIYGIIVAFKNFRMSKGILGSPWAGLEHFKVLFTDSYFYKVLANTLLFNFYSIICLTVFTIFLALLLNEIRLSALKRVFQTMVYFPNFISWIVFAGIFISFLSPEGGAINIILKWFGIEPVYFLASTHWFITIVVGTGILKSAGFGTIIYLASLAGINPELYESAVIDGANRGQMMLYITLPRLKPTIAVMLILSVTGIFANVSSSNFEQVFAFLSPMVMDKGDIISTYLYRTGLLEGKFEVATALGLVFNVIGLFIIIITNKIVNKMEVTGVF